MSEPSDLKLITPAYVLGVIAQWNPDAAPNEEGGLCIMEAIDLAQAALANLESQEPMTDAEYAAHKGLRCPYCRTDQIDDEHPEMQEGEVTCEVSCCSCGKHWLETYRLAGYEPISK
jgi:hypothetical protein